MEPFKKNIYIAGAFKKLAFWTDFAFGLEEPPTTPPPPPAADQGPPKRAKKRDEGANPKNKKTAPTRGIEPTLAA
jgi:hypothetical protein